MPQIELSAGTVTYDDTNGHGPTIVMLHGVLMSGNVWRNVVAELGTEFRCIAPTLPLGGHAIPMRPDADLSIDALALLVAEFLERLNLRDVTLVMNDWGGAQLLVEHGRTERITRLVLVACEAFDNFPPGKAGRRLGLLARIPGGLALLGWLTRSAAIRRSTLADMTKRGVPDEILRGWFGPLTDAGVRRDLRKYIVSVPLDGRRDWSHGLAGFTGPALVVWAAEDRLMPPDHGRRLASLLPKGHLVEIDDTRTLVPEDQPQRLASVLDEFVRS
jgi:pimeloyl-ACP methyl ester carboxylesterase